MPSPATKQTSFLDLPAELRNDIYHLALLHGTINIDRRFEEPALLATTLQIRAETMPTFYGANTFEASCPWSVTQFMMDTSPEKLAMLRTFNAVNHIFAIKLQPGESYGGVKRNQKNLRYIKDRVHRLVDVQGKGALKRDVVLVPVIRDPDSAGVEWMTLAELERLLVLEGWSAIKSF